MTAEFLRLDGDATTVVLELAPGSAPLWRYWGPSLAEGVTAPAAQATRPRPTFALDVDRPLTILPTFGFGASGQPALLAHRDGRDFAQDFRLAGVQRTGAGAVIRLIDEVAALTVEIALALGQDDVLAISATLGNRGAQTLDVQWLASATLPLPADVAVVRSFTGRHNHEFVADDDPLGAAIWRRENRRGLTAHDGFPGALVHDRGVDHAHGRVYAAQLAWSGNSAQSIQRLDDGRRQWQLGMLPAPGEVRLGPGEALATPEVLATVSDRGFDGAAQNFHKRVRARMTWPGARMAPRPVHLNTWEGIYFDHRIDDLKSLADSAAALGVERFVLDDGWFEGRRDDSTSLGDWTVDRTRYPDGLAPLADHVVGLGMEFGLWIEPEMASPSSALLAAHPDWTLSLAGRPAITGRNQLVLDLARTEVADHLFAAFDTLLRTLPVSYLKWDHNRELAAAGGPDGRPRYRAQTRAAYALMDRIRAAHPRVEIESCAGGGGRIDAGVLERATRFWVSDCLDARVRLTMQRAFLQFFPPEVMGSHVGASPAHSTGRTHTMSFRALTALAGHFGIELDPRRLSDDDRAALGFWVRTYKALRDRLHAGPVWRGDAGDGVLWQAHGDAGGAAVFLHRVDHAVLKIAPPVKLGFLAGDRRYRVEEIAHPDQAFLPAAGAGSLLAMRDGGAIFDGGWLARHGLPCPLLPVDGAALLVLTPL